MKIIEKFVQKVCVKLSPEYKFRRKKVTSQVGWAGLGDWFK